MGSPNNESGRNSNEGPQHEVTITRSFYMQTHEVTQGEWQALMENNPSDFSSCGSDCPVEQVNWYETLAYANALSASKGLQECYVLSDCVNIAGNDMECDDVSWNSDCLGYQLPTEAEWEYAIRANTTTMYYNGDDNSLGDIAWYNGNSGNATHPVGEKEANSWGLYDMSGNVWEWCWDLFENYDLSLVTDPMGPTSSSRVSRVGRGGSWRDSARRARSAYRTFIAPGVRFQDLGFRLVSSAP